MGPRGPSSHPASEEGWSNSFETQNFQWSYIPIFTLNRVLIHMNYMTRNKTRQQWVKATGHTKECWDQLALAHFFHTQIPFQCKGCLHFWSSILRFSKRLISTSFLKFKPTLPKRVIEKDLFIKAVRLNSHPCGISTGINSFWWLQHYRHSISQIITIGLGTQILHSNIFKNARTIPEM